MLICFNNKCKKEHDGSFGSGKYCSKSCANSRSWTPEQKKKVSESLKGRKELSTMKTKEYACSECGNTYKGYNRYGKCASCRRKVGHFKKDPKSILELSKRTVSKLLKRAKKSCSLCGWGYASCDVHHIEYSKDGGTDEHANLVILCPNCHRSVHEHEDSFAAKEELKKLSIDKTFLDWKDYYCVSNV